MTNAWKYDGDYYTGVDASALDAALKQQLHALIEVKTTLTYDAVWEAFAVVDRYLSGYPCNPSNESFIPDIYSGYCWAPEHNLTTGGECGNYKKEGDCFNREHSWPNSWFGGNISDAYTDLFLLFPSDGYVNNRRSNMPLGNVNPSSVVYASSNGCKIGACADDTADYTGQCFEPADYLKGDLARSYFYISVAYMDKFTCCEEPAVSKWDIHSWEENILRKWHEIDAVDDIERQRNDVIFTDFQHNRNPFIDHPEWVGQISDF